MVWGWGISKGICTSGGFSSQGVVLELEFRLGWPGAAPVSVARGNQCKHIILNAPLPFTQVLGSCSSAWKREIPSKSSLLACLPWTHPSLHLGLQILPAPGAVPALPACKSGKAEPVAALPLLLPLLWGRIHPPGHEELSAKALQCQPRKAVKMLRTRLQQFCLHPQPSCPVPGEAEQPPSVCGTARGDTEGDRGCWQHRGSRAGQSCHLQGAPAPEPGEQEARTGLLGGKSSGSCQRDPRGLNGDAPQPPANGSSLALADEPAAPTRCPGSAPELPHTAENPTGNPSHEWKVVKIQRVLINPDFEPRKAGKRNPLWPLSSPERLCCAPGESTQLFPG